MSSNTFNTLFSQMFTGHTGELRHEDHAKGHALMAVIAKSTASISDVVKLADALDLNLHISASSKPKPEPKITEQKITEQEVPAE
ncbi:hypothetical protein CQ010_01415 [Arthrobacter sp. MYb211]|uniref:hypothetical protein n=1 Tax=unclassified Arthrobacter TaxID=235627 RepID=UPI000CFD68E9|nr:MULTISPECIES: hypothetical protein [unclassified Arthrobacter]PRA13333.1 hypothetical protein CQ015_03670 [Arthrobacter sp. MYb221]PRC10530.1 hypothetical protein CQ010_01415 [Arthrobacter sp. MYb211]